MRLMAGDGRRGEANRFGRAGKGSQSEILESRNRKLTTLVLAIRSHRRLSSREWYSL